MNNFKLNNGIDIPKVGFGVYMMTPEECETSLITALQDGYRLIDTANAYMNERAVGRAMKKSGVNRKEIFLTTKLWPSDYGYEKTKKAIDATLARLEEDYIDLLLLHQQYGDYIGAWKAMEEAVNEGKLRAIGLSNFNMTRLKEVIDGAEILPSAIQVECHPYCQQGDLKDFLNKHGIKLESWYPIGHGDPELLNETLFTELGAKYNKSNVQIILRWQIQDGNIIIPKSINPKHIKDNFDIFDFELTNEEMKKIKAMDKNKRYFEMSEEEQEKRFLSWKPDFDVQK